MKGRALIDLPEHKLKCGEYGEIDDKLAKPLVKAGRFDPKAVKATTSDDGSGEEKSSDPDGSENGTGTEGEGSGDAETAGGGDSDATGNEDATGTPLFS